MTEQWRDVVGFEDAYEASNYGRFRNKRNGNFITPISRGRYLAVSLKASPKKALRSAHTAVAEAFFGPRPMGLEVAHLNGDAHDNRLENLKYVTCKENEQHKKLHGTSRAMLSDNQAAIIRRLVALGVSQTDLAVLAGVSDNVISKVVRGRNYVPEGESPVGQQADAPHSPSSTEV